MLEQMRRHLSHENAFIHEALERRSPALCTAIAREHDHHLDSMADLGVLARALRDGDARHADQLALRLYRHLADFTAENFVHMREEETVINARLWSLFSDDDLSALHDRLLASIPPDEMASTLRWLLIRLDRNPRPDTVAPAGQDLQSGGLPCARMPRAQAIHLRSRPPCPSPRSRVPTSIRTWTG